jgi:hypothetical protein
MIRTTPNGEYFSLPRGHFAGEGRISGDDEDGLRKILVNQRARQRGLIPSARRGATTNPTANDTFTIGGKVFKFVAALGAADTFVQVLRGGTAAISYTNLVNAINGDSSTSGTTWKEATTAFALTIKADMAVGGTKLRLRWALSRGGRVVAGIADSITLANSITGDAAAWSVANLNAQGKKLYEQNYSDFVVVVTAAMVTEGHIYLNVPFVIGSEGFVMKQVFGAGNDVIETNDVMSWSDDGETTTIDYQMATGYTGLTGVVAGHRIAFHVVQ